MNSDTMQTEHRGACLCGAVSVQILASSPTMGACHCKTCRAWSGGPFMSVEYHDVPQIQGMEHVTVYSSSDWAERGFCSRCGTHLFYRLKEGSFYALSVGLFQEGTQWPFDLQVFIDQKPQNYQFANTTRTMTGEEVFNAWS